MGQYIYGTVMVLFLVTCYVVYHETQLYQEHYLKAKYISEEVATSGAQYNYLVHYADGYYNFDKIEGEKAIKYFLQKNFGLDKDLNPLERDIGYWPDQMKYNVTFIDYQSRADATFPSTYEYTHFGQSNSVILNGPSVILTIDLGKAPYRINRLFKDDTTNYVTAIHTFED